MLSAGTSVAESETGVALSYSSGGSRREDSSKLAFTVLCSRLTILFVYFANTSNAVIISSIFIAHPTIVDQGRIN